MSKKQIFTVKEVKAEAYLHPFTTRATGEAIRSFSDEANNKTSGIGAHPADYILFHLGEFDEISGKITLLDAPHALGNGSDFVIQSV